MTQETTTQPVAGEQLSLHIYMSREDYERQKGLAEYAKRLGLIKGHPKGNFSSYVDFALGLAEQYLKGLAFQRRGFK